MFNPIQLTATFLKAINDSDEVLLRSICDPAYQGFDASREARQVGRLGLIRDLRDLTEAFPDRQLVSIHEFESAGSVGLFWLMTGTHGGTFLGIPATGRRVSVCGFSHLDFGSGLLCRATHLWDMAALLRSLRLLPQLPGRDPGVGLLRGMRRTLTRTSHAASPRPTS